MTRNVGNLSRGVVFEYNGNTYRSMWIDPRVKRLNRMLAVNLKTTNVESLHVDTEVEVDRWI